MTPSFLWELWNRRQAVAVQTRSRASSFSYQAQAAVRDASSCDGTKLALTPRSLPADKLFIPSRGNLRHVKRNVKPVKPFPAATDGKEAYARMSKRALIVDDEAATRQLIEKVLTSRNMECVTVSQSAEASELLSRGKFAVVFVDSHMPFPDGLELTRQMRDGRHNRMTTVILMSEDRHPKALSKGFEAGASFFLYKPVDKDQLLRLVRATQGAIEMERRRTRRIPMRSLVRLQYGKQEIEGETVDVSMEGLLVKCPRTVPIGSSVGISLHLNSATTIVGAGSVVRFASANEMGIHLGRLGVAESQRLQDYLLPLVPPE